MMLFTFTLLPLLFVSNIQAGWEGGGWSSSSQRLTFPDTYFDSPGHGTNPIVYLKDGALKGFTMQTISGRTISAFQNIPFAQPPVGALRFKEPRKNLPWSGVRDATVPSPDCVQIDTMRQPESLGQEDCLYINVYTPQTSFDTSNDGGVIGDRANKKLPVLLFLHGGSFLSGAGSLYGPRYLLEKQVLLLTVNYRLGAFGFLSTGDEASPGNNGLKDQVAALKWVRENIYMFGGDPNAVTIFGQSAGAGAVQHHIVSPLSRGLFHGGISHSGSGFCWWAINENAPTLARRTGELFNCRGSSYQMVECLRRIDAHQLVNAQRNLTDWRSFPIVLYGPVVEHNHPGAFLTQLPKEAYEQNKAARIPWITGFTRYEMSWLFADFLRDPSAAPELNRNWERLGEIFLTIRNATGTNSEIASRIRNFYLGEDDTEISFRNRNAIAQMVGDRFFLQCGLDGMRYHSRYTGESVYGYEFSFEGKYSVVQKFGQNAEDWGVAHMDDLIYLQNSTDYYPTINLGDSNEVAMSNIMTDIWSNFAQFGNPYVSIGGRLTDTWQPIQQSSNLSSPLQFLDLNLRPRMIGNPFTERYNFWKSLQLTD